MLAGTSARNSGLKINEGSVLSSELTETERTSAGSLLTTRQPGLLLQLFRPQTTSAGRGCSRSSLGAAPCVTAQEATKERRRARHCQGSSGHLAQPGGELDYNKSPSSLASRKKTQRAPGCLGEDPLPLGPCGFMHPRSGPWVLLPREAQPEAPSRRVGRAEFTKPPTLPFVFHTPSPTDCQGRA